LSSYTKRTDKNHGRIEIRTCYATDDISWIDNKSDWAGFKSIAMVTAQRIIKGVTTSEIRYYITSVEPNSERILVATRTHWGIENSLHYILDVIFGEDKRILWNKNIAHNESIIRKVALNLLKMYKYLFPPTLHKKEKVSIKALRKFLSYDDTFMIQLLQGFL
jgi:predicted transposase YbfD/YdcC